MNRQSPAVNSIAETRKALNLSREELAFRAHVTLRTIERIEAGEVAVPHRLTRQAIARVLECEPSDLWPDQQDAA